MRAFLWTGAACLSALSLTACAPAQPESVATAQMQELLRGTSSARSLVGSATDPRLRPQLEQLGVTVREGSFTVQERSYSSACDTIIAVLPDPVQPLLPLTIIASNDGGLLAEGVAPGWRNGVQVWRGPLLDAEYALDPQGRIRLPALRTHGAAQHTIGPGALSAALEAGLARAQSWAGVALPAGALWLFSDLREYAVHGGGGARAHFDARSGVTLGISSSDALTECIRGALRTQLGAPADRWVEDGAAQLASGRLCERELAYWWSELAGMELPSPAEICAPDAGQRFSPWLILALRARAFELALAQHGAQRMREVWSRGPAPLPLAWSLGTPAVRGAPAALPRGLRGVLCNGGLDAPAMQAARELGANAILVRVAFAIEHAPRAFPLLQPAYAIRTIDGDARLVETIRNAKTLGMRVLVEADVLRQPSSGLIGDHPPGSAQAWERCFDALGTCLEHLALTAQASGADALSLGRGLVGISRATPYGAHALPGEAELRARGWTGLQERVRRAFHGPLTYTSVSLHEILDLAPANGLDALGIRCDIDFHDSGKPRAQARSEHMEAALRVLTPVSELAASKAKDWMVSCSYAGAPEDIELLGAAVCSLPAERRPQAIFIGRWPGSGEAPRSPGDPLIADETRRAALAKVFSLL